MSERDDRLDQRELAQLWHLENEGRADRRAELEGERFVSLFTDVLGGRSFVFEHGAEDAADDVSVGDAEFEQYDTAEQARIAYGERIREAREQGTLVDDSSEEDLGDAIVDGPLTTEVGSENLRNDRDDL
jgi:hypothetical protein